MGIGPSEVQASADAATAALRAVLAPSSVAGSRQEWASAVGSLQQVLDVAAAVQDAAIVRLAAIEPEWCEDGTVAETHRALGHVAVDAPSILSGVLSSSAVHAERRVAAAVLLAADGVDGVDGVEGAGGLDGTGGGSGLGGLHAAMGAGRLDAYRASVVAEELQAAPPQVRAAVVTVVEPYLAVEDGAHLRRRCRRALARISPDLLRQRALRARSQCGLRRCVAEPGVDRWEGTFPCEDAATAWAAIDALAHRYVKDGVCTQIEAARGKALTDLVAGAASIDAVLTLTVPAASVPGTSVPATSVPATSVPGTSVPGDAAEPGDPQQTAHTGRVPPDGAAAERDATPAAAERDAAPAAAELDAAPAAAERGAAAGGPAAVPGAAGPVSEKADDLVEVTGPAGSQPVFVSRAWVSAMATSRTRPTSTAPATAPSKSDGTGPGTGTETSGPRWRSQAVQVAPCHPDTGALIDPATDRATVAARFDPALPPRPATAIKVGSAQLVTEAELAPGSAEGDTGLDSEGGVDSKGGLDGQNELIGGRPAAGAPLGGHAVGAVVGEQADTDNRRSGASCAAEPTANPRPQAAGFAGGAYRPSTRMAKRVKARDRRCRFPGCTIAAVFCDLDHVRPWPHGPTADTNLICLCRRHHRVKQRPGWAVALAPDATVTWTDPTGLVRTTAPADALTGTVLSGAATSPPPPASTSITLTDLPDGPHSDLEFHLEHHVARVPTRCRATSAWGDEHGGRHHLELQPAVGTVLADDNWPCRRDRPQRHPGRRIASRRDDPPPF